MKAGTIIIGLWLGGAAIIASLVIVTLIIVGAVS